MSLHEVRGQFWGMCDLQLHFDLSRNEVAIRTVTSEGHASPGTDL